MDNVQHLDIALVGPAHPYRGGISHFIEKLQGGFSERGHESRIYTFTRQYPDLLFPGKTQLASSEAPDPAPIRVLDTLNPVSWYKTARNISARTPAVVVFKYWMPFFAPAFGTIARRVRKNGARVVVVVDNALPHERRPGDAALARYFLSAVDACIVMSEKVKDDLLRLGFQRPTQLVQHPTYDNFGLSIPKDVARERLGLPRDDDVLLFFGFVRKYKGLHTLLDAMPAIVKSRPRTRLVVAGEFYEDEDAYRQQIIDLDIDDHVVLLSDYIPDEDVAALFSACDVVVQPYLSATQSGVAQIAFNYDRPVITTNVGGLAEIVTHGSTGLVVEPESPESLADAVISYFDRNLAEQMSAAVARDKSRFSWDAMYDAILELGGLAPKPQS